MPLIESAETQSDAEMNAKLGFYVGIWRAIIYLTSQTDWILSNGQDRILFYEGRQHRHNNLEEAG